MAQNRQARPPERFRPATNADAVCIRELVFAVLAEYRLAADPDTTDRDLFDIESSYAARGGCFEVLVDGLDTIIGCYGLYPLRQGVCELRKMYLAHGYRGCGRGKAVMHRAMERARVLGFSRIELETAGVLREAIALYRSFGFRPFMPEHMSARCDQAMFLDLPADRKPSDESHPRPGGYDTHNHDSG
jgi:putative acetyltransferase